MTLVMPTFFSDMTRALISIATVQSHVDAKMVTELLLVVRGQRGG